MAEPSPDEANPPQPPSTPPDPTFTSYTTTQSTAYSASRPAYPSALIATILTHHTATTPAPSNTLLLDVGSGPGTATRSLSPYFHAAIATDPSPAMISTARSIPSTTLSHTPVAYHVCAAEDLLTLPTPPPNSVDLLTAAMAAHWFDLPRFYAAAATLLRPGGTLALWTAASLYVHPHRTPHAAAVQAVLFDLERNLLSPYETAGNRLSRDMYDALPLPWTVAPPVPAFPEPLFVRREWNRDGAVAAGETFLRGGAATSLGELAASLGTASMVTRWREANADAVESGAAEDCVDGTMRRIREAMGVGGGEEVELEVGSATALLMFKKAL